MANYVYNRVVCTKEILNKYFLDDEPFEEGVKLNEPYITFNKLFNTKLDENYSGLYGESIYYGDGFKYNELENGNIEILFNTRWRYPIKAIEKALELCKNDIIWYAVEENLIYVSKFYWDNEIREETLYLEDRDNFNEFNENNPEPQSNFWIWEYPVEKQDGWKIWQCNDFDERYFKEYPAQKYYKEMDEEETNSSIRMNIDDTYFEFGVDNYVAGKENDDNWSNIKIKVHNSYFQYFRNSELMTSAEVDNLLGELEILLNDELKEKLEIGFYEPDLEFVLYPKINLWDTGKYVYIKEGHEIQDIYMELNINLTDKTGAYTGQKYVMIFDREEIERIVKYLKNIII